MIVTSLNASITCIGLAILGIHPLLLLTTIVLLLGLIPVLGVWISSVPIVLIAFNDYGLVRALMAVGVITIVHILEAYVFNPRVYAARFHLNPVIVLIVLLVGHELFGVWGMLLGIPVTHYVLNIAQVPSFRGHARKRVGTYLRIDLLSRPNRENRDARAMTQFRDRGTMQQVAEQTVPVAAGDDQVEIFFFGNTCNLIFRLASPHADLANQPGFTQFCRDTLEIISVLASFFVLHRLADEAGGGTFHGMDQHNLTSCRLNQREHPGDYFFVPRRGFQS